MLFIDAVIPLLAIAGMLLVNRRHFRLEARADVPWLAWGVAVVLVLAVFGSLTWIGTISADEYSSLPGSDQPFLGYLVGDRGLPSRLHRLVEWPVCAALGLQGIRLLNGALFCAAALLVITIGNRLAGTIGLVVAFVVLFDHTFIDRMWEARAYPLVLVGCCWALSMATMPTRRFSSAQERLVAVLLPLSVASLDNPLCWTLALGCVLSAWRRNELGRASLLTFGWVSLVLVPLVWAAVDAHQALQQSFRWGPFLVYLIWFVPLIWVIGRGRDSSVAEATAFALACTAVLVGLGILPDSSKTFLFLAPWCWMSLHPLVPSGAQARRWLLGLTALCVLLPTIGASAMSIHSRLIEARTAQSIDQVLAHSAVQEVSFSPHWKAVPFVSGLVSLRKAKRNSWTQSDGVPPRYLSRRAARCTAGEVGVVHADSTLVCDCPVISRVGPWHVHQCASGSEEKGEI